MLGLFYHKTREVDQKVSPFPPCHTGLSSDLHRAERGAGSGDRAVKVLRPETKDRQRSAHQAMFHAGAVSINWQGEEEINL